MFNGMLDESKEIKYRNRCYRNNRTDVTETDATETDVTETIEQMSQKQ